MAAADEAPVTFTAFETGTSAALPIKLQVKQIDVIDARKSALEVTSLDLETKQQVMQESVRMASLAASSTTASAFAGEKRRRTVGIGGRFANSWIFGYPRALLDVSRKPTVAVNEGHAVARPGACRTRLLAQALVHQR